VDDGSVWVQRRVIAYAHQGGAWESPSSTRFAINRALAAGATAIELDVHATLDGELVVCHDATVDRTTPATGNIASFTLAELQRLDFSYWFIPGADVTPDRPEDEYPYRGRAPDDPEFGIATLRQVLEQFPDVVLNLDIKQTAPTVMPYEESLARLLREFGRGDDVMVASFLDPATDAFRTFAPEIPTSAGTIVTAEFWRAVQAGAPLPDSPVAAYQVPERMGDLVVVDEAFVAAAHGRDKAVHVWTINEAPAMERLLGLGVDGIISDVPTPLVDLLRNRGVAWDGRLR
jgi:glycerophosphoryl diester phosphodiesterase